MDIVKYKWNDREFLIYNINQRVNIDITDFKVIERDTTIKIEWEDLPIFREDLFLISLIKPKIRHRDKILEEYNISKFWELRAAYELVRRKIADFPKQVRDYVVEKYTELINEM